MPTILFAELLIENGAEVAVHHLARLALPQGSSDANLFGYRQVLVDLNALVTHGAPHLLMR